MLSRLLKSILCRIFMNLPELTIQLPDWVGTYLETWPSVFPEVEDRMNFVVDLSRQNIDRETGGPFGAAVFDAGGRLIAPGVNRVIPQNCSILHAEMVAMALAQQALGRFDLSDGRRLDFELCTSTEPCAMCFGAVCWAGISRLVCGARKQDAESIGFDEGPKPENWIAALNHRGIEVITDICREKAAAVLKDYAASGAMIYNSGAFSV